MVFVNIGTYSVSLDRNEEFFALYKRISEHMKENAQRFKHIKSHRLFKRSFGGTFGEFVDLWEFESWAEYQEYEKTYETDKVWGELWAEFMRLVEPSTHSWTNVVEVTL
jgi:hypothetical protein